MCHDIQQVVTLNIYTEGTQKTVLLCTFGEGGWIAAFTIPAFGPPPFNKVKVRDKPPLTPPLRKEGEDTYFCVILPPNGRFFQKTCTFENKSLPLHQIQQRRYGIGRINS